MLTEGERMCERVLDSMRGRMREDVLKACERGCSECVHSLSDLD